MNTNELSVLSLNCWGLNIVSKKRRFRLRAIADAISTCDYDIVTLQELWMWEDFDYLKQQTQSMLPYAKYFYSGALGSGLAILSRFPIVSTSYFRYSLAGRPLKVFHGDFYVGKGCGSACIEHPDIGILEVFTTHLHAGYGNSDEYEGHRVSESWELAHLLRASAAQGRHVIATGDFNSIPTSYNYQLLKAHAFMTDSWLEIHQDDLALNDPDEPPKDIVQQLGITCDSPMNTWTKREKLKQQPYSTTVGDRLDYIFYRKVPQLSCIHSSVVMTEHIPGTQMSYSDHFGVHSIFSVTGDPPALTDSAQHVKATQLAHPSFTRIELSMLQEILDLFKRDQVATRRTASGLLVLFVLLVVGVIVVFGVFIGLPVEKHSSKMMVNTLGGLAVIAMAAIATICLIVGFVFGRTEQRALRQFVLEVDTLMDGMRGNRFKSTVLQPSEPSSSDTDTLLHLER
ncbi:Endonuclease/exonuclease/phosphatase [Fennellomyces sp. T-0311]|nr:Endonuclease/exonuclease/phosphatase [Fennellomyces sp. T-0311]